MKIAVLIASIIGSLLLMGYTILMAKKKGCPLCSLSETAYIVKSPNVFTFIIVMVSLTLKSPMDIRGMFMRSYFGRLDIYLTDEFEIAKDMEVAVNSNSSHEDWVNYRNSDNSDELTSYEDGGHIRLLHLKFDPNKMEHAITLIRNLGFGCVQQIRLEATGEVDGSTCARWIIEALKPYTEKEKAIKSSNGQQFMPYITQAGENFTNGLRYPNISEDAEAKGYTFS